MPPLGMMNWLRRVGARRGVKRDGDDRAQPLRHYADCILKLDISLSEIFGNHGGFLLECPTQCRLAGRKPFEWKAQTARPACKSNAKRSRSIGLEQESPVRVRHGYRMVEHRAKNGV